MVISCIMLKLLLIFFHNNWDAIIIMVMLLNFVLYIVIILSFYYICHYFRFFCHLCRKITGSKDTRFVIVKLFTISWLKEPTDPPSSMFLINSLFNDNFDDRFQWLNPRRPPNVQYNFQKPKTKKFKFLKEKIKCLFCIF